jgi:hypothetical protein
MVISPGCRYKISKPGCVTKSLLLQRADLEVHTDGADVALLRKLKSSSPRQELNHIAAYGLLLKAPSVKQILKSCVSFDDLMIVTEMYP